MLKIEDIAPEAPFHRQISDDTIAYVYPMTFGKFRLIYGNAYGVLQSY